MTYLEDMASELGALRAAADNMSSLDTLLQQNRWNESSVYSVNTEAMRCSVCGTRLALDHLGACPAQDKHAAMRLLTPRTATLDAPVFDKPSDLVNDCGTVNRVEQPAGTCFVSLDKVIWRAGREQTMFGLETPENETPPAALRYLNERKVPALDWTALAEVERFLKKNKAQQRRAAMLREILVPANKRSRAAKRVHLETAHYSQWVTPELLAAAAAALLAADSKRSKQDTKRNLGAVELVAGGKIAAALSGGSSAYLVKQWEQRSERKAVAYALTLATGGTTAEARQAALDVYSVQAMGTHTAAATLRAGKVTSPSTLVKPELTEIVGRTAAGGRPKGKRKNSKCILSQLDPITGEKVLIGKVNSGNGQVAKMRVMSDKNTALYNSHDLAVLAALQGKRGGASSKKRKALHTVVALRAALASW